MCFSAQASFATAGFLSIISLLSIKQVHTKKIMPLALTPLFFAIQQASEGFVWITLNNGDTTSILHLASMYLFLFFAGVFWPTWIPTVLYIAESAYKQKHRLLISVWCGIVVSLLLLYCWILQTRVAEIVNHHINYPVASYPCNIANPLYGKIASYTLSALYGIPTIIPFFISSISHMKILGITIGIGALIAYIFYLMAFASVWCFFAAVCSIITYCIVYNYEKTH